MNSIKWIALAAVAVTLTVAATHKAFADSGYATDCQTVANGATRVVEQCWFFAGDDARERQICSRLVNDGNAMIRWCNNNINRCEQNYVSWYLYGDSNVGTDWRADCAYGTR